MTTRLLGPKGLLRLWAVAALLLCTAPSMAQEGSPAQTGQATVTPNTDGADAKEADTKRADAEAAGKPDEGGKADAKAKPSQDGAAVEQPAKAGSAGQEDKADGVPNREGTAVEEGKPGGDEGGAKEAATPQDGGDAPAAGAEEDKVGGDGAAQPVGAGVEDGGPAPIRRTEMPRAKPPMGTETFRLEVTVHHVGSDWKRSPAASVPVLVESQAGQMTIKKHTGLTNASGVAVFEGLRRINGARYVPVAAFQEVSYGAEPVVPKGSVERVSIDVYDKTYDDSNLQVSELMTTAQVAEGSLIIFQRWLFVNNAPQTFDPRGSMNPAYAEGVVVQVPLDARQASASLQTASGPVAAKVVEDKVLFQEPVPPAGENQKPLTLQVQFALPIKSAHLEYRQPMLFPTEGMRVIVARTTKSTRFPELDLELTAPGFQVGDNRDLPGLRQDMKFLVARGGHASPGEVLSFSIDGLPARDRFWAWLAIGVAIGVLLAGFGLWRHEATLLNAGEAQRRGALAEERESLYGQLADLEDRYDAGEVSDYRYDLESARLRERLALVLHRLGQGGDAA